MVSVKGRKGVCTFWNKVESGEGWNIVMARPGIKQGQGKFSNMNGWGLAVLGWCKGGDCELGADRMYLTLHKKEKKFSIFKSPIFAIPPAYGHWMFEDHSDDNSTDNATANDTNSTNSTTGGEAPAAPAPAAAPAASAAPAGGAAAQGNATNGTNKTKKNKTKKHKKKKLPEPYAGDNSDDEAEGKDLSYDIGDYEEEDWDGLEMREKVNKASEMYETPGGYLHVKWLKWLKLFNDDDE
jgi:hypothetical protein